MESPKYEIGEKVRIQPFRDSQPMWGIVRAANWNKFFKKYGYTLELTSHSGHSTAWEHELHTAHKISQQEAGQ